jgi:hypothetical protein
VGGWLNDTLAGWQAGWLATERFVVSAVEIVAVVALICSHEVRAVVHAVVGTKQRLECWLDPRMAEQLPVHVDHGDPGIEPQ